MDQIGDPNNSPPDIYEAHCRKLVKSSGDYNYHCEHGMMKVYHSSTISSEGATYATALRNFDCMKFLRDGLCMVMVDGCHRHRSIETFTDKDVVQ